jgi:hypothetical protein
MDGFFKGIESFISHNPLVVLVLAAVFIGWAIAKK